MSPLQPTSLTWRDVPNSLLNWAFRYSSPRSVYRCFASSRGLCAAYPHTNETLLGVRSSIWVPASFGNWRLGHLIVNPTKGAAETQRGGMCWALEGSLSQLSAA